MKEDINKAFDESLRNKLSKHRSELPRDLWEGISAEMYTAPKQGKMIWRKRYLAVLILFPLAFIYLNGPDAMNESNQKTAIGNEGIENKEIRLQAKVLKNIEPAESRENETLVRAIEESGSKPADVKFQPLTPEIESTYLSPKAASNIAAHRASIPALEPKNIPPHEGVDREDEHNLAIHETADISEGNHQAAIGDSLAIRPFLKEEIDQEDFLDINDQSERHFLSDSARLAIIERESQRDLFKQELLPSAMLVDTSHAEIPILELQKQTALFPDDPVIEPDEIATKTLKWKLRILAGPSLSYRSFRAEASPQLQQHKNSYDRKLVSGSYALSLARDIHPRVELSLGLTWFDAGEKYEFSLQNATHRFTNHYKYVSIPLEIDYNLVKLRRIGGHIGTGLRYCLLTEGNSSWVDVNSMQPISHSNKGPESPFNENAWALSAHGGLRYAVSDRIDAVLQEHMTLFLESLYKNETGLDQRPYIFNTQLGLSIKF